MADGVLHVLVHLGIGLPEPLRLKHRVPPKLVVAPGGHDAAVGAADEDDGGLAGAGGVREDALGVRGLIVKAGLL